MLLLLSHVSRVRLCATPCDPIDGSPPGSRPWDSPGKSTGVDGQGSEPGLLRCRRTLYRLSDRGSARPPAANALFPETSVISAC